MHTLVDELDVGHSGLLVVGHPLLQLLDCGDGREVDVQLEGLLLGWGLEIKLDHLKILQIFVGELAITTTELVPEK